MMDIQSREQSWIKTIKCIKAIIQSAAGIFFILKVSFVLFCFVLVEHVFVVVVVIVILFFM